MCGAKGIGQLRRIVVQKKNIKSKEIQDSYHEGTGRNSFLHREMRALKDYKALLRNSLLQHEPRKCNCNAIHCFNLAQAQAQRLALGVGPTLTGPPMSPSPGSANSVYTPGSYSFDCRTYPAPSPSAPAGWPNILSRTTSPFGSPLNYAFAPNTSPGGVPTLSNLAQDWPQMPQQFADFFQDSPDEGCWLLMNDAVE
jgi:hypothetical protein